MGRRLQPPVARPRGAGDRRRAARRRMFEAAGWQVVDGQVRPAARGACSRRPGGEGVRVRIDAMSNERVPAPAARRRRRAARAAAGRRRRARRRRPRRSTSCPTTSCWPRCATSAATTTPRCSRPTSGPRRSTDRPTRRASPTRSRAGGCRSKAIRATTRPCSPTSSARSWRASSAPTREDPWRRVAQGSAGGRAVHGDGERAAARRVRARRPRRRGPGRAGPQARGPRSRPSRRSGALLVDLSHEAPEAAKRIVTVSPDVASSTNLGGWINRAGIWSLGERIDWFGDDTETLVQLARDTSTASTSSSASPRRTSSGLLGELGATWSRDGEALLPIGTIYDPFVGRALEPWSSASTRAGSRSSWARRRG